MKATVAVLAFTAIVPIPAATWAQQIVNAPGQPIEVTESALDLHGPIPRLTFKGSNVSQQPIGAWGFLIKFKDESGKTILRSTHFGAKIIEPSNQGIAPRQVWYEKIELPKNGKTGKPYSNYEVTVDYVAFQNGSPWGKDEMKMSQKYADWKTGVAIGQARDRAQSRQH